MRGRRPPTFELPPGKLEEAILRAEARRIGLVELILEALDMVDLLSPAQLRWWKAEATKRELSLKELFRLALRDWAARLPGAPSTVA